MADSQDKKSYLDINELTARSGLSRATIWRLKRAGKIRFFQPAGKNGRVKFPEDAIEQTLQPSEPTCENDKDDQPSEQLPGPRPAWMSLSKLEQS